MTNRRRCLTTSVAVLVWAACVVPAAAESEISVAVGAGPASGLSGLDAKHFELSLRSTRHVWFFGVSMVDYRESQRNKILSADFDSYSLTASVGLVKTMGRFRVSAGVGPSVWVGEVQGFGILGVAQVEARVVSRLSLYIGGHREGLFSIDNGTDIRAVVGGFRVAFP